MSAFLGISVAHSKRLRRGARTALLGIESSLGGPTRRVWGDVRPGRSALLSWERASPVATVVRHDRDAASVLCGVSPPDGVWSRADVDGEGGVAAACDDLGYGTLFHWAGDGIAAVATRPELLVAVAAAVGEVVSRDCSIAAELAYLGWLNPTRTGWQEIAALRAGERIALLDGVAEISTDPHVATWVHEPPVKASVAEIVERAAAALTDSVRRTLESGHETFADLTAGRDSRMVVAALVALDALDSVTLQTIGEPDLADVATAEVLAEHLGARHRHGFFYPFPEGSFAERFHRHVESTAGVSNVMDGMREPLGVVDHVRLSGLAGEVIRGWPTSVTRDDPAVEVLGSIAGAFQAGRIGLLRPEARRDAHRRLRREVLGRQGADLPGWFAAHRYYAEVRLRSRMARVDDFTPEVRAYPLYTRELIAAGTALLWHHPGADLADLVIERLVPGLDSIDVAATGRRSPTEAKDLSFMQVALARQVEERRALFASIGELESEAWDHIDRSMYVDAVARYGELTTPELRLLHGAAGGVIWASDQVSRRRSP